jgi:hypothetical protein
VEAGGLWIDLNNLPFSPLQASAHEKQIFHFGLEAEFSRDSSKD